MAKVVVALGLLAMVVILVGLKRCVTRVVKCLVNRGVRLDSPTTVWPFVISVVASGFVDSTNGQP